jgi:hypothetical protein
VVCGLDRCLTVWVGTLRWWSHGGEMGNGGTLILLLCVLDLR